MKIFFCDICNESIPLQDIKENKATTIKGKIFCLKCNPLNELAGTEAGSGSAPAKPASAGAVGFLGFVVVLLAGGLGYALWRLEGGTAAAETAGAAAGSAELDAKVADLRTLVSALQTNFEALVPLRAVPAELATLKENLAAASGEVGRLAKDSTGLVDGLAALGKLRERVEALALRQDEQSQSFGKINAALAGIQEGMQKLADRPPVVVAGAGGESDAGGDAAAPPDPELVAIIEHLSAAETMTRWEAVEAIRRRGEKALVPHVMPLLDDKDTFVRAQAIYTLGELKAMAAVPKLVKLLRDEEIMIREEAMTALVGVTKQSQLKFDVNGSKANRDKGVKKWEEWLATNKDLF